MCHNQTSDFRTCESINEHSVWTAVTEYQTGWLQHQNLFSRSTGGWKSKIRWKQGSYLVRPLFLAR